MKDNINNIINSKLFYKKQISMKNIEIDKNDYILQRDDKEYKKEKNKNDKYYSYLCNLTLSLYSKYNYKVLPFFQSNAQNQNNKYLANNVMLYWIITDNLLTDAKYIIYRIDYKKNEYIYNFIVRILSNIDLMILEPHYLDLEIVLKPEMDYKNDNYTNKLDFINYIKNIEIDQNESISNKLSLSNDSNNKDNNLSISNKSILKESLDKDNLLENNLVLSNDSNNKDNKISISNKSFNIDLLVEESKSKNINSDLKESSDLDLDSSNKSILLDVNLNSDLNKSDKTILDLNNSEFISNSLEKLDLLDINSNKTELFSTSLEKVDLLEESRSKSEDSIIQTNKTELFSTSFSKILDIDSFNKSELLYNNNTNNSIDSKKDKKDKNIIKKDDFININKESKSSISVDIKPLSILESLIYVSMDIKLINHIYNKNKQLKEYLINNYEKICINLFNRKVYVKNIFLLNENKEINELYSINKDKFKIYNNSLYNKTLKSFSQ